MEQIFYYSDCVFMLLMFALVVVLVVGWFDSLSDEDKNSIEE